MILRAVIYARCSTEEESQKDALVNQVAEAKECVRQNGWILVDSYVESRSGTTTKGRLEYNRLYEDLCQNKFDIIIIKSQDRLMRNVKDWYLFLDRLVSEQKRLYMYIDRKFYSADDSLITGIKAILAEDYSRELSKKLNNAHRNRQKNNGTVLITSATYGYDKLPDKSVVINEEEAKVVRRMYELCAAGFGSRTISAILQNEGIFTRHGKPFDDSSILRIIHSPLHKGTVVMNRKHFDFEKKKTLRVPIEEQFVYENKVPAIVSEELWEQANAEIAKRADERKVSSEKRIGIYKGKSQLSSKLYCGLCGNPYYRKCRRKYRDGTIVHEWKCKTYLETGRKVGTSDRPQIRKVQLNYIPGCNNVHLLEKTLYELLQEIVKESYASNKEEIINHMIVLLKSILKEKDVQPDIERYSKDKSKLFGQLDVLVDKLLDGTISDEIYKRKQQKIQQNLDKIQQNITMLEKQKASSGVLKDRITRIENALRKDSLIEKATVDGMLEEVEKIMIYPTYLEIYFSISKMIGLDVGVPIEDTEEVIRVEFGNRFNYHEKKREDRELIIDLMRENPKITAKMIAKELGFSKSGIDSNIKILKDEGRIYFNGKGGKGSWVVVDSGETE